ncbi:MAG: DUF2339 domain-containing protein, partial [Limisphaerales bacterium]
AQLSHELGLLSLRLNTLESRLAPPLPARTGSVAVGVAPAGAGAATLGRETPARQEATAGRPETAPKPPEPRLILSTAAQASVPPPLPQRPSESQPAAADTSLEMRLGTYWLVRVGIVMVLTGLVFFGHLAYENYIRQLGPGGKVCLLYLASAVLLVAGGWWQRRASRPDLRNYGQVLFAGGLAALYFTTYAAHHIDPLRVIPSALVDGVLLLVCAGLVVAAAQHWKSEVLGVFAIGLAYYTAVITQAGFFTLYSNLVLTAAAVLFLVRNRWATLSFAGLVASYVAYGFWRFLGPDRWHASEQVWPGICFLAAYWTIFSAGVFLSRDGVLAGPRRATFLTLNNNAFLLMFFLTMIQARQDWFWAFALVYGTVLLVLAAGARQALPAEPLAWNSYLSEGLLLVTLGLISKFSGSGLALLLAMESVVLLLSAQRISNTVLLVGAYASAGLAAGWSIDAMGLHEAAGRYTG